MINTVKLIRGSQGAGKSFTVNKIIEQSNCEYIVCSADHYFIDKDGKYNFNPELLGQAWRSCEYKFIKALEEKIPLIIVDNVHRKYSDLRDFVVYGAIADYEIELVESKAPWAKNPEECFKRNQHGVALHTIEYTIKNYMPNEIVAKFCLENLGVKVKWE